MAEFAQKIKGDYAVKYIHKIQYEDEFFMNPHMLNFQYIKKGETIGHDKRGIVTSPKSGYLLMPLYQSKGKEGFYLIDHVTK